MSGQDRFLGLWVIVCAALVAGLGSFPATAGIIDNLVGNWTFDNSGDLGIDGTGNNPGHSVVGGVSYSTGSRGVGAADTHVTGTGAALFNGSTGYISVDDTPSLDSAAGTSLDRSVSFWFKTTTAANTVILEKGSNTHFVIQTESVTAPPGKVSFRVDNNNVPRVISANAVNDNLWHHFAATFSGGSGTMELYIDGISQGSNVQASPAANNNPLAIGARIGAAAPYPGRLDDLGIWSRILSKSEIAAIYQGGLAGTSLTSVVAPSEPPPAYTAYTWGVLKDNPRFYWSFNEAGTNDAIELVRRQTDDRLRATGNATRVPGYSANLNNAISLDGAGDYFMANALGDGRMPGAWAIEMWVKADGSLAGSRQDYLMNAGSAASNNNPAVIYDFAHGGVDNELELYSAAGRTEGNPRINDTNWHHVVYTFYGNNTGFGVADRVDMAIDGVVTPSIPRNGFSSSFDLTNSLIVGAALATGVNAFQGKIDEMALYDLSGLTEAQVAARMARIAAHFALASQPSFTPLLFAQGVTYQSSPAPGGGGGAYADPTNTKLTNGVVGSTVATAWATGAWAGWQNADPVITFDLGTAGRVDSMFLHYLVAGSAGIHAPDSVLIQFSMDGTDFSSIGSILSTNFNDADPNVGLGWSRWSVFDLQNPLARYIRLTFSNDSEWTFLGEAQFVLSPEPTSLTLLAVGLIALRRRRRRAA